MKKTLALILALVLVCAVFTGCGAKEAAPAEQAAPAEEAAAPAEAPAGEKKLVFGVAHCVLGEDYWQAAVVGMQKAADELGIELVLQSAQNDPAKQVEQIENFISQGVDAIICSPVDVDSILTSVKKCNEAGIPFVFSSRITDSNYGAVVDSGVGYEVLDMSKAGATWLVDYAKANNIHINLLEVMGSLTDSHTIGCRDGLAAIAEENPDYITVVNQVPTDWDPTKALSGVVAALQADDSINAIFYHSDALFPAIRSALEQLDMYKLKGEDGHIVLMACGGTADTLDAMKEGYVDALEVTPIVEVGYQSVYQALKVINGEIESGTPLLYDAYILDETNYDEMCNSVYGYAAK